MGMAASQARLLSLQARMSNVEYQGQQINQERTVLSQQCTDLYNSLLSMTVPTPPSTTEYSKIEYTGVDGASTFTLGAIKPQGDLYVVEMQTQGVGASLTSDSGYAVVKNEGQNKIKCDKYSGTSQQVILRSDLKKAYFLDADGNVTIVPESAASPVADDPTKCSVAIPDGSSLCITNPNGVSEMPNPNYVEGVDLDYTIAGNQAYTWERAQELFPGYAWDDYKIAIENRFQGAEPAIEPKNFWVYFEISETGVTTVKFALETDVTSSDMVTETFSYTPNGKYVESNTYDECQLEFDTSGRITKIGIPSRDKTTGEINSYKFIDLKATSTTDNQAYEDAYNKYEYAMYEYDKRNQEINAKTEIIQQEDKNLELKLQRLDNERTMLKTEIDACKTVIKDNIDASYKTFSG